ncbi:MAG: response regulator transcription factor [Lentimicrobium sp.]|nr:response regulator transcription factor [Lentimicrobium sp.]
MLLGNLSYIKEVKQASDGEEFLSELAKSEPELVFMDISMPIMDGIKATKIATTQHPDLKIIALSMFADEDYYTRMIDAGARGFILKNSGMQQVEECIQCVVSGNNYFSPEILSGIVKNISRKAKVSRNSDLSEREEEVLYRICQGLSNQEIADIFNISKRTVDKHRENLLLKTDSKNTAGLVMYAIRQGIVEV